MLVFRKDLLIEAQTGEVVVTSGFFAVLVVVLSSMSFFGGPATGRVVLAGAVWLSVLFAAVLSLGRSWAREREGRALFGLLACPLSPSALYAGKCLALLLFLFLIELLTLPLAALFFSVDLASYAGPLLLIFLFATPAIAATGTLFGAMTLRTSARDLALSIVLLPLLSPVVLTAVAATRGLITSAADYELFAYLRLLLVMDVTFLGGGLALFGSLIED